MAKRGLTDATSRTWLADLKFERVEQNVSFATASQTVKHWGN
jgi:hypothetical protein